MPVAPASIDEYRHRIDAFNAARGQLKGNGKCHVCGRYSGLRKLCYVCNYYAFNTRRIDKLTAGPPNYPLWGTVVLFLVLLPGAGLGLPLLVGAREVSHLGQEAMLPFFLGAMALLLSSVMIIAALASSVTKWRVPLGAWPRGGKFVRWEFRLYTIGVAAFFFVKLWPLVILVGLAIIVVSEMREAQWKHPLS
jgi:hypothetical protein